MGSEYIPGSAVDAWEEDISDLTHPVFNIPVGIPAGGTYQFTIRIIADCGIVPYNNSGQFLLLSLIGHHDSIPPVNGSNPISFNLDIPVLAFPVNENPSSEINAFNIPVDSSFERTFTIFKHRYWVYR